MRTKFNRVFNEKIGNIVPVGIGPNQNVNVLESIASNPDVVFQQSRFSDLNKNVDEIVKAVTCFRK